MICSWASSLSVELARHRHLLVVAEAELLAQRGLSGPRRPRGASRAGTLDDDEARPWKHPYLGGFSDFFDDAPPLGLSDVVLLAAPFHRVT